MPDRGPFLQPGVRPGTPRERWRKAVWIVLSMGWLALPIVDLATSHPSPLRAVLAGLGFVAFVGIYLAQALRPASPTPRLTFWWVMSLGAIAIVMTLFDRPIWGLLFTYTAVAGGISLPENLAPRVVLGATAVCVGVLLAMGDPDGTVVSFGATTLAMGLLMFSFGRLIKTNRELECAREELAESAVNEERLRFARDVHDLLGHNLSVIALKAQLARRLMDRDLEAARGEIADVEQVTRTALTEVREAVAGYRQPTLARELAGARSALDAAGIACTVEHADVSLPPSREAVLAWGVREATTNVIRHSGARRCDIRVEVGLDHARLEVTDDGRATNGNGAGTIDGHGLRGLAERATSAGGRVAAGPRPDGGYGLVLSVPLGRVG